MPGISFTPERAALIQEGSGKMPVPLASAVIVVDMKSAPTAANAREMPAQRPRREYVVHIVLICLLESVMPA